MLKTGDTFERDGKTWRFLGLGIPQGTQCFLTEFGSISQGSTLQRPVIEEVIPEWITPTDEHAKQRPECEVRCSDSEVWRKRTLVYVRSYSAIAKYLTDTKEHGYCTWPQCRIRNPEYKS